MTHCCEQIMMPRGGKWKGNASTTLVHTRRFYLMSRSSEASLCTLAWNSPFWTPASVKVLMLGSCRGSVLHQYACICSKHLPIRLSKALCKVIHALRRQTEHKCVFQIGFLASKWQWQAIATSDPLCCIYSNKDAALPSLSLVVFFFLKIISSVTDHRAGASHREDRKGILIGERWPLV